MVEHGEGGEHVLIAGVPDPDAEVHVIEGHRKALVQAAHLLVQVAADHEAGAGDAVDVVGVDQAAHIAGVGHLEVLVHMGGQGQMAKAQTGVLDGVVGVEQLGAHAAHPLLLGEHDHFLQPAGGDDLGVVVEEQQVFTGGKLGAEVVQGAVVEAGALPADHPEGVGMLFFQLFVGAEGLVLFAVVLDDQDLKVGVSGLGVDGLDAGAQVLGMVAAGDQDADLARMLDGVVGLVEAGGVGNHGHLVHRHPYPLIVGIQGLDGCFQAVELGLDAAGHAGGAGPPVVEHMGNMDHLLGFFGEAEVQVVVLAAVVLAPLAAAGGFQQAGLKDAQVADIVVGPQVVQHEIGLEVIEGGVLHLALKGNLVGVDEVGPLLHNGLGHIPQGRGMQDVVVVQQGDVLPCGQGETGVGVAGNALVAFQLLVADPAVLGHAGLDGLAHLFILAGVHQAQLPVLVGLVDHRVQQLGQEVQRGVVQRHHDADFGPVGLVLGLADQQVHRGQAAGLEGAAGEMGLIILGVLAAFGQTGKALPAQLGQQDKQREGMPQLPQLAEQVADRPGDFPAGGTGDVVEGGFQLVFVLVGGGQLAALVVGELLVIAAALLGPVQLDAQAVQFFLIGGGQVPGLAGGRTEQGRAGQRAPALPSKIPPEAGGSHGLGPDGQGGSLLGLRGQKQQAAARQGLGRRNVPALDHHQVILRRPAGGQGVAGVQPVLPCLAGAQAESFDIPAAEGGGQALVPQDQHPPGPKLRLQQAGQLFLLPGLLLFLQIFCALHFLAPILSLSIILVYQIFPRLRSISTHSLAKIDVLATKPDALQAVLAILVRANTATASS